MSAISNADVIQSFSHQQVILHVTESRSVAISKLRQKTVRLRELQQFAQDPGGVGVMSAEPICFVCSLGFSPTSEMLSKMLCCVGPSATSLSSEWRIHSKIKALAANILILLHIKGAI